MRRRFPGGLPSALLLAAALLAAGTACAGAAEQGSAPADREPAARSPEASPDARPPAGPGETAGGQGHGEGAVDRETPSPPAAVPGEAAATPSSATPSSATPAAAAPASPRRLRAEVVATYPHDPDAFTQGLLLDPADPSVLLESTGRYGRSQLRRVDLESGRVIRRVPLADDLFAEGLAFVPGSGDRPPRLVQLTWRAGVAKVWDPATFEALGEHRYGGEGWGLCYDAAADRLVLSNGSPWLAFHDPGTFAETGGVEVRQSGRPVAYLNELECVGGKVWANVYGAELVLEIDPESGTVTAVADARGLLAPEEQAGVDVFNGIAHDPADGTFLLTGKLWPKLFRVRFVEP